MAEKDEEGDLLCQERNLTLQIHSQDMNERKQTDLDESKNAKAPARLQHDGIYNLFLDST
jgi:hypothetical protein